MIHYRDMTFCPFADRCKNAGTCERVFTDEGKSKAEVAGLPVAWLSNRPE